MKTPILFCCLMAFLTCCVFTWKAESTLGEVFGFIAIIILMASIGYNLIAKLMHRSS